MGEIELREQKKWILYGLTVVSVIVLSTVVFFSTADADSSSTPGQASDPLVTQSYVDAKVEALVKAELEKIGSGGNSGGSSELVVVTVPFGQKLIVASGGELIVRTGKAVAYSADANGLSDMTDGLDIAPGKPVATNHLILFPRGDRGVQANPNQKNGLIVLVRGTYTLQ